MFLVNRIRSYLPKGIIMSKTDNTRKYEVQAAEPNAIWVSVSPSVSLPIVGGWSGKKGHGKQERKADTRQRRRDGHQLEREAKQSTDMMDDAIQPKRTRADRRTIRQL